MREGSACQSRGGAAEARISSHHRGTEGTEKKKERGFQFTAEAAQKKLPRQCFLTGHGTPTTGHTARFARPFDCAQGKRGLGASAATTASASSSSITAAAAATG